MARRCALPAGGVLRLRASRARAGFESATLSPDAARYDAELGEYLLDWDAVLAYGDPHAAALDFVRSAARYGCAVCDWDPALAASIDGDPPPIA